MSAQERYVSWLTREVFLSRTPAQPETLARAIQLFVASAAQIPDASAKQTMLRRLLTNPRFAAAVREDDTLSAGFASRFESARVIGGVAFEQRSYLDAATMVDRGTPVEIKDRSGNVYEARPLSSVHHRRTGLGLFRDGDLFAFDADWRRLIPNAHNDRLLSLLQEHRIELELDIDELSELYNALQVATPLERVRLLDAQTKRLGTAFIFKVAQQLNEQLYPEEIVPVHASILERYAGMERSAVLDVEAVADRLLARTSGLETFERLAGLPVTMPRTVIIKCVEEAGDAKRFVHSLLRTIGTPISLLHVLRVVVEVLPTELAERLKKRLLLHLIAALANNDFQEHLAWVRWITDEIARRIDGREWSPEKRYAVAWIFAHQTLRLLRHAGYSYEEAVDTTRMFEGREDAFFATLTALEDPLNPRNIGGAQLFVGGTADAIGACALPTSLQDIIGAVLRIGHPSLKWTPSIFHSVGATSPWVGGDRIAQLKRLLDDQICEEDEAQFAAGYLEDAVARATEDEPTQWAFVAARITGTRPNDTVLNRLFVELGACDVKNGLLNESPLLWRLRLAVLARAAVRFGGDAEVGALVDLWQVCLKDLASREDIVSENLTVLVEVAAYVARLKPTFPERVAALSASIAKIAESSALLARHAGVFSRRLLKRLPASTITPDLSRAALLARFRTDA